MDVQEVAVGVVQDTERLSRCVTAELLSVLVEAASNEHDWKHFEKDGRAFLAGRGIELPDDVYVRTVDEHAGSTEHIGPVVGRVHAGAHWCDRTIQLYVHHSKVNPFPTLVLCVGWK